jgi:hypothetical protein
MWRQWLEALLIENGPIETATAVLFFVAALFMWVESRRSQWPAGWAGSLILLVGGFRELDFQNRFTSGYVLSSGYFLSGAAPVWELLAVLLVLLALSAVALEYLLRNWRCFLSAIGRGRRFARSVVVAASLTVFTVLLDRGAGHLRQSFGGSAADVVFIMWVFEESLELLIPAFFIVAIVQASVEAPARVPETVSRRAS